MNNSLTLRYLLLIILSIHDISPADAQKDSKEFPKPKVMTGEDLQRMGDERKRSEEYQKRYDLEQAAWAKKHRVDEYPNIVLNDIFKFGFAITILLAIAISIFKRKPKGLEYYFPSAVLLGVYALHCGQYSQKNEFGDCFISGIKIFIIAVLFSVVLISVFVTVISKAKEFPNNQRMFTIIITALSTAIFTFLLTSNIEMGTSDKSPFILYPWNWLAFLLISSYLFYQLMIKKQDT
ncbi:MAG: hypothetical protein JNK91_08310 [Ferruginibacter sp.]|nr:hypothetical protein [Ferruginibacter sp.]